MRRCEMSKEEMNQVRSDALSKLHPQPTYTLEIKPKRAVRVGEKVSIRLIYREGNAESHNPVLELFHDPYDYPPKTRDCGVPKKRGDTATFSFIAKHEGIYALRLLDSSEDTIGRLIEILVLSTGEIRQIRQVLKNALR